MLHTTRRMLDVSGSSIQSLAKVTCDGLVKYYLVQMLLLYRVSWLRNAR